MKSVVAAVELDFCTVMPLKLREALYLFRVCGAVTASLAAHKSVIAKRRWVVRLVSDRSNRVFVKGINSGDTKLTWTKKGGV